MNDLHTAIKFCKVYHFDTDLLHINNSTKKLNKFFDFGLRHLSNWLNVNKILLDVNKIELTMFKPRMKNQTLISN